MSLPALDVLRSSSLSLFYGIMHCKSVTDRERNARVRKIEFFNDEIVRHFSGELQFVLSFFKSLALFSEFFFINNNIVINLNGLFVFNIR